MPNPYYIPALKSLTGNDKAVYDYVMGFDESKIFLEKLLDMLDFLIPQHIKEGKTRLIISIGCTGGKHRSVTIANALYSKMTEKRKSVMLKHIDCKSDGRR